MSPNCVAWQRTPCDEIREGDIVRCLTRPGEQPSDWDAARVLRGGPPPWLVVRMRPGPDGYLVERRTVVMPRSDTIDAVPAP